MLRRHISALLLALALLFAQGAASAHVAEFGDSHEHDGVACAVALVAEDADTLPPAPPAPAPVITTAQASDWQTPFASTPARVQTARAPPPRAPPH